MKILVCVKEVPDIHPEVELTVDQERKWIKITDQTRFMMNRFDEYAVEEAVRIKEKIAGTSIDAITVGPQRSHEVLRRAMGMGVDNGIHIKTDHYGYIDPVLLSTWISGYARGKDYDLILCGVMSEDVQSGCTGVMVAAGLSIPWASSVVSVVIEEGSGSICVERELEGGARQGLELPFPCLLTVQTGINQPRYPALSKVLRAKKAELTILDPGEPDSGEAGQAVMDIDYPQKRRSGEKLTGSAEEKARQLLSILKERSFLA